MLNILRLLLCLIGLVYLVRGFPHASLPQDYIALSVLSILLLFALLREVMILAYAGTPNCCKKPSMMVRGWCRYCLSCGASWELLRGRWTRKF